MTPPGSSAGRWHALDNLRAVMMWLGIVLHVAIICRAAQSPVPWRDRQTSQASDLLGALIHMPATIGFGALLYDSILPALLNGRRHPFFTSSTVPTHVPPQAS